LADALRSEMILHNISIHLFMPAGIDTPGFVEEEKEKPAVTRKIEESDDQISPEKCAEYLIAGGSLVLIHSSLLVSTFLPSLLSSPTDQYLSSISSRRSFVNVY
jgi:hypothetical protein